jgi:hypothetical protein
MKLAAGFRTIITTSIGVHTSLITLDAVQGFAVHEMRTA